MGGGRARGKLEQAKRKREKVAPPLLGSNSTGQPDRTHASTLTNETKRFPNWNHPPPPIIVLMLSQFTIDNTMAIARITFAIEQAPIDSQKGNVEVTADPGKWLLPLGDSETLDFSNFDAY